MTCYSPMVLYKSRMGRNPETGKWPLTGIRDGYKDLPVTLPCGRCIGCRLETSRQWAIRCLHESQEHLPSDYEKFKTPLGEKNRPILNCFITLTYRDSSLIHGYAHPTLYPKHLQNFWKYFRKAYGAGIRFFACGEYATDETKTQRPHYHACVFGFDFPDRIYSHTKNGIAVYNSESLNFLWGHGDCKVGDVTFESAAYVARYIMDKKLGHESKIYSELGIEPEFIRMSRRPGIGSTWLKKFKSDIYPQDNLIIRNGVKSHPPKYYNNLYQIDNPEEMLQIKAQRQVNAAKNCQDNTVWRLRTRERIKTRQIQSLAKKPL